MPKQKIALFFILLLCSFALQGAVYSTNNPLILGADDNPVTGDKDYQDMIVKMFGNFDVVALCGTGQTNCNALGGWQNMVIPDQNGVPYWDGNSADSALVMNVGNYALGTGGFTGNPTSPNWSVGQAQYWGTASGGTAGFAFTPNGGNVSTTMVVEISANSNINYLAWALASAPNTWYTIFSGPATEGATASFTPTGQFIMGFSNGQTMFRSDGSTQAMALMQGEVPEPMTFVLMGVGLVGVAILRRRNN